MTFKEVLKTTEGLIVIIGSLLGLLAGKFWIVAMLVAYIFVNVPSLWIWIKNKFND